MICKLFLQQYIYLIACCLSGLPMARRFNPNRATYIKDSFNGEMLQEGIDSIFATVVKRKLVDGNGKAHYLTLNLDLSHNSFMELILNKIPAKNVHWLEWIPPTDEEKEKAKKEGKEAYGTSILFKGVVE